MLFWISLIHTIVVCINKLKTTSLKSNLIYIKSNYRIIHISHGNKTIVFLDFVPNWMLFDVLLLLFVWLELFIPTQCQALLPFSFFFILLPRFLLPQAHNRTYIDLQMHVFSICVRHCRILRYFSLLFHAAYIIRFAIT